MASYIKDMRKFVGHRPVLMCGASVFVEDDMGRILLERRSDNGCWGYPGGAVELYEEVEEAARRELLEETGITAHELELFGVFSGKELSYTYPNKDEVSIVDIAYICRSFSGTLKPQKSEVTELVFFDIDNIPANLNPPCVKTMRAYLDKRKKETSDTNNI